MKQIPTHFENPKGLHLRYIIQKVIGTQALLPKDGASDYQKRKMEWVQVFPGDDIPDQTLLRPMIAETDEGSEYFVMRLDEGGSDPEHIKACRKGIHAYADAIEHHLPELAKDLRERYPLID